MTLRVGFVFAGILLSSGMWGERRDVGLVVKPRAFSMSTLQTWAPSTDRAFF